MYPHNTCRIELAPEHYLLEEYIHDHLNGSRCTIFRYLRSGESIGILEPDGIPKYRAYYYRLSDHEYILPINNVQGRVQFGIYYVDTKKDLFDQITGGGSSIVGAIHDKGITWLITYHSDLIHGVMSEGYNAIMIKDKKSGKRPYQVFDLASISTSDSSETDCDKTNPCICLSDSEEDAENSFYALKGYDVKDLNGDSINDMVFHIEQIDCAANKRISIKETYYFLPQEPFVEKKEEKSFTELPAFSGRVGHSFWIASVAFSPDGRYALSGSWDGTMKFWEIATGKEIRTFKGAPGSAVYAVAFSPDGRYALSGSGELTLWEVATGKEIKTFLRHSSTIASVAFSPDGRYLLSWLGGDGNPSIKLWEVATGKEIRTFESKKTTSWGWIPLGSVESISFSPDGRYALSLSFNNREMMLWDVATGKGIRTFTGHSGVVASVAFSPDGRYALSGSRDRTIKLWDIATGKEIRTFTGHSNIVTSVAFSPDGRYVLSGSGDKTIKLWDIATAKEIRTFTGHSEVVNSVAFSPDGRYVLSGSNDVTLRLWDATTGKEIRTFGHPPYIKDDTNDKGKKSDVKKSQQVKVDVNAKDKDGYTALMNESKKGNIKEVRNLLASSADINAKSADGKTALIFASGSGYLDVVQALLASGADVNVSDSKGNTALMASSVTIYVEVVKKLLEAGAAINARNKDGVTALMLASGYGRAGVVVTDMKGKMEIMNNDPVGNVEVVKALIAAKAGVNIRSGKNGRTALMGASRFGSLAVIKELIAAEADVNVKDNEGCTALIEASRYGYTEVVRELLAAKADVNIKSDGGVTALKEASKGYDDIVKLLKEAGAKE